MGEEWPAFTGEKGARSVVEAGDRPSFRYLVLTPRRPYPTRGSNVRPLLHALIWLIHRSYFDVVKRPMDLSTMTSKLKAGDYGSRQEFADDFNLMLSNAYLFNPVGTQPHNDALEVEKLFKKSTPLLSPYFGGFLTAF